MSKKLDWSLPKKENIETKRTPKALGAEEGKRNHPPAKTTRLTGSEQEICDDFISNIKKKIGENSKALDKNEEIIDELYSKITINSFEALPTQNKQQNSLSFSAFKSNIKFTYEHWKQANNDLNKFKERNNLDRSPNLKSWKQKLFSIILIATMIAIEITANTKFLGSALLGGETQARITAITISGINVGISFLIGLTVMQYAVNHINTRLKAIFGIVLGAYVTFYIWLNFSLGAFRSNAEELLMRAMEGEFLQPSSILEIAATSMAPWNFIGSMTLEGWLLVVIGIAFATIGLFDGYNFSDSYPGYGKVGKKENDLKESILSEEKNFREQINKNYLNNIKQADGFAGEDKLNITKWSVVMQEHQASFYDYDKFVNESEDLINHLLNHYREANEKERTEEAPAYFSQDFKVKENIKDAKNAFISSASSFKEDGEIKAERESLQRLIQDHYKECCNELSGIKAVYEDETKRELNEFIY